MPTTLPWPYLVRLLPSNILKLHFSSTQPRPWRVSCTHTLFGPVLIHEWRLKTARCSIASLIERSSWWNERCRWNRRTSTTYFILVHSTQTGVIDFRTRWRCCIRHIKWVHTTRKWCVRCVRYCLSSALVCTRRSSGKLVRRQSRARTFYQFRWVVCETWLNLRKSHWTRLLSLTQIIAWH